MYRQMVLPALDLTQRVGALASAARTRPQPVDIWCGPVLFCSRFPDQVAREWAQRQGGAFLFPTLIKLKNPSTSASSCMQHTFERAGIAGKVGKSSTLRGGHIEMLRDNKIDPRDRCLQAGHKLGEEHDLYGFKSISQERARELAFATLRGPDDGGFGR